MKKTKKISLSLMRKQSSFNSKLSPLMLAVSGASLLLASCSSGKEEAYIANSAKDCADNSELTLQQCNIAYKEALAESAKTAPRYESKRLCEDEFGDRMCQQAPNSNVFMPLMAGFLIGNALGGSSRNYNPVYSYYGSSYGSRNSYVLSNGKYLGDRGYKKVKVQPSTYNTKKPAAKKTISRGGFGSTASAKSSWGSSSSKSSWGG